MASEKPAAGPEPQPAGLISVGAGGGGGGGGSVAVMGELRASGAGSVVLPAGMINPSVPIRNIRMKFAVLIGLIQVGEVSNRDIVETVLNLVSGRLPAPLPAPGTGRPAACPAQPETPPRSRPPCAHGPSPAPGRAPFLPNSSRASLSSACGRDPRRCPSPGRTPRRRQGPCPLPTASSPAGAERVPFLTDKNKEIKSLATSGSGCCRVTR